jgi:recombination protein RecT
MVIEMATENATATTAAIQPVRKEQRVLRDELEKMKHAMAEVMPKHLTPDRLVKVVLSCTVRKPELLDCTIASICRCVMQAAELGLELGGLLGEAYLVPYGKESQCIIGYQGLLKLARQSDQIASTGAHVVYDGDLFEVDYGENRVIHKPSFKVSHADTSILAGWAKTVLKDGSPIIEAMSREDIDRVRCRSKASKNGPWVTDYAEMARKSVLRRHLKYVPRSAEITAALEHDQHDSPMLDTAAMISLPPAGNTASLAEELTSKKGGAKKEKPAPAPKAEPKREEQGPAKETPSTTCAGCKEEVDFAKAGEVVNRVTWHRACLAEARKAEGALGGREPGVD